MRAQAAVRGGHLQAVVAGDLDRELGLDRLSVGSGGHIDRVLAGRDAIRRSGSDSHRGGVPGGHGRAGCVGLGTRQGLDLPAVGTLSLHRVGDVGRGVVVERQVEREVRARRPTQLRVVGRERDTPAGRLRNRDIDREQRADARAGRLDDHVVRARRGVVRDPDLQLDAGRGLRVDQHAADDEAAAMQRRTPATGHARHVEADAIR